MDKSIEFNNRALELNGVGIRRNLAGIVKLPSDFDESAVHGENNESSDTGVSYIATYLSGTADSVLQRNALDERFGSYAASYYAVFTSPSPITRIGQAQLGRNVLYTSASPNNPELSLYTFAHEIGHIYFYGILANNEMDEAWMDEGFTTNQTRNYMVHHHGPHGYELKLYDEYDKFPNKHWPLGNSLHSSQWYSINFMRSGFDEPISRSSYQFLNGISYRQNAYTKPALMLNELNYILGDSVYYGAMKYYYDTWKLKHVNELKFIRSIEEFTNRELDWFFDPWLHTTNHLDYGIKSFKKSRIKLNGKWKVNLEISSLGDRFLPILVETEFKDGTVNRRWWENHLWRFNDTLSYTVDQEPVRVTIDPDVQSVDLDYRNNTTKMNYHIMFDWPGNMYNPRDQYVVLWKPHFYFYRDSTDLSPGLNINWYYGPYENTTLLANYSVKTKDLFWYLNGWRELVHILPRTKFHFWSFNKPILKEFGGKIEKKWNRVYGRTPTHYFSSGFYIQTEYDSTRAIPLGYNTNGKLAVGYLTWDGEFGPADFDLNGASTLGSYSTWKFTRLTGIGLFEKSWKNHSLSPEIDPDEKLTKQLRFKQRVIIGKIWTDENGVPGQEGYNVEGNSSNDLLRKSYLVDRFYGNEKLFSHYHLPGEGNLRGFIGQNERGAEALVGFTTEVSIYLKLSDHNAGIELATFIDGGVFWDRQDLDKENYVNRNLLDGGFGFRFDTSIFEHDLYFRIDIPFFTYNNSRENRSKLDFNHWIVSFQRSI